MRLRFRPDQPETGPDEPAPKEVVVDLPSASREAPAVDAGYQMQQLGRVIRDARQRKRLSLEALAVQADVSSGLLSQIERGFGNPSFVTLTKIATALDVPMPTFYQGSTSESRMLVTRRDRQRLALPHGITYELLSPDWDGPFVLMRASVPGKFSTMDNPVSHDGTETTHVLAGQLDMTIAEHSYSLRAGDSITFDSAQMHWISNPLNRSCEFLVAVTAPDGQGRLRSVRTPTQARPAKTDRD